MKICRLKAGTIDEADAMSVASETQTTKVVLWDERPQQLNGNVVFGQADILQNNRWED